MSKIPGKIRNAGTQTAAKAFDVKYIAKQALQGTNNGEPMQRIVQKIMSDPHIKLNEAKNGTMDIIYEKDGRETIVGWTNGMMGEISQSAYDKIQDTGVNGAYVVKEKAGYAVRLYDDTNQLDGMYLNREVVSEDDFNYVWSKTPEYFESYDDASYAADEGARELGIASVYERFSPENPVLPKLHDTADIDALFPDNATSVPSTGGYNPRTGNTQLRALPTDDLSQTFEPDHEFDGMK